MDERGQWALGSGQWGGAGADSQYQPVAEWIAPTAHCPLPIAHCPLPPLTI
jgi:hypothetical protein